MQRDRTSGISTCQSARKGRCITRGVFRNEEKKNARSPDYSGYLVVLPLSPDVRDEYSQEEWDDAPRLNVYGRRVRNADNSVRIALDVVPLRSDAPVGDDEVAF